VFAAMATNGKEEWKDHGCWIMAEEAEKPMLWITDHAVLEGRQWSALGKEFGEILEITTSKSDFLIFHVHTAEDPLLRYKLHRKLLFASILRVCVEAKPQCRLSTHVHTFIFLYIINVFLVVINRVQRP
jgi:hypothetical protein